MNILANDIKGEIGAEKYVCKIAWRNGIIIMDEPQNVGGNDKGPDPFTMLLASLAGCTLSTLRMYIDRKGWDIPSISVQLNMHQEKNGDFTTFIKREINFEKDITLEQKERLLVIANKCPISKILENKTIINTNT